MLSGTFGQNVTTTAAVPATTSTPAVPAVTTFAAFTWDQFWGLADNVFNPPDVQNDAAIKLADLRQGSSAAEVFFIEFDMQAGLAGYDDSTFDIMKICMANQQLNKALVDNIHNTSSLPTMWQPYKDRAIALDRNFRTGRAARANKTLGSSTAFPRQQQQHQPVAAYKPQRDPNAMDVDTTRTRIATTTTTTSKTPSPKKTFSLDADGRVIGGREELLAAGACFYCRLVGHMTAACPALAKKAARPNNGTYTPLQRPNNFRGRSQGTSIASSPERVESPTPSKYSTTLSQASSDFDTDFVVGQE
jgi:hypothetical protein